MPIAAQQGEPMLPTQGGNPNVIGGDWFALPL